MVYGLTANGYIVKYIVNNVTPAPKVPICPYYQYYRRPNWGSYSYPTAAWFSYDHTRIFFNNGLTLTSSTNEADDLQVSWESFAYMIVSMLFNPSSSSAFSTTHSYFPF